MQPQSNRYPFPDPPQPDPDDTNEAYRSRLALYALAHLSQHGGILTARLTDEQLEETARGLSYALTGRVVLRGPDDSAEPTPEVVYNHLAATLADIRIYQAGRARERQERDEQLQQKHFGTIADTHPSAGQGHGIPIPPGPPPALPPARMPQPQPIVRQPIAVGKDVF